MESLLSPEAAEMAKTALDGSLSGERRSAAMTQPQRGGVTVDSLVRRQGFHAFCPFGRVVRHRARKTIATTASVFRGYVLVRMNPGQARWRLINGALSVRSLVTNGNSPLSGRPSVIETLAASTDTNGILAFADHLQPGMAVRLRAGPLAGQLGMIERRSGNNRLILLMNLMKQARMIVCRDMIRKVM